MAKITIEFTDNFERQSKRLLKKYPLLKNSFIELKSMLLENPQSGTPIGENCYKIRMAIPGKNKGKSGGARIITHVHIKKDTIYLISIYDKSERTDISDKELKYLIAQL